MGDTSSSVDLCRRARICVSRTGALGFVTCEVGDLGAGLFTLPNAGAEDLDGDFFGSES
jgi:hypothetical protein